MNLTRRSLFASAVALLALPRKVAAERLLAAPMVHSCVAGPTVTINSTWSNRLRGGVPLGPESLARAVLDIQERMIAQMYPRQRVHSFEHPRGAFYVGDRP